ASEWHSVADLRKKDASGIIIGKKMVRSLICTGTDYFFQNGRICKINQKPDEQSGGIFQQQPPNSAPCTPARVSIRLAGRAPGWCPIPSASHLQGADAIPLGKNTLRDNGASSWALLVF